MLVKTGQALLNVGYGTTIAFNGEQVAANAKVQKEETTAENIPSQELHDLVVAWAEDKLAKISGLMSSRLTGRQKVCIIEDGYAAKVSLNFDNGSSQLEIWHNKRIVFVSRLEELNLEGEKCQEFRSSIRSTGREFDVVAKAVEDLLELIGD